MNFFRSYRKIKPRRLKSSIQHFSVRPTDVKSNCYADRFIKSLKIAVIAQSGKRRDGWCHLSVLGLGGYADQCEKGPFHFMIQKESLYTPEFRMILTKENEIFLYCLPQKINFAHPSAGR